VGLPIESEETYLSLERRPYVTYLLVAVNTVVFFFLLILYPYFGFSTWDEALSTFGCYPADVFSYETFYRVIISMFVHASILHLAGNMFFLYVFGRDVEKVMGYFRFILFYLTSGIIATLFNTFSIALLPEQYLIIGPTSILPWDMPAVGASGAISGILGAYFILYPKAKMLTIFYFFPILMSSGFYIGLWFIYQLALGLLAPLSGIAFWAHIGGFLGGIALTPLFINKELFAASKRRVELLRKAAL